MAKKILVIDDEPDLLVVVSHGLKKRGYEVFCGRDGREVLALTPELMPDLILLDVGLPVMNGDEVARLFKDDAKLKHIPIVLISSVSVGLVERFAASGAEACLQKPFEFEELIELVNKYCGPAES